MTLVWALILELSLRTGEGVIHRKDLMEQSGRVLECATLIPSIHLPPKRTSEKLVDSGIYSLIRSGQLIYGVEDGTYMVKRL